MSPSSRPTADELEAMPPAEFAAFLKETGMTRPSREALAAALFSRYGSVERGKYRPMSAWEADADKLLAEWPALPPAEVVEDPSAEAEPFDDEHHPSCCGACDECLRICGGYHGPERRANERPGRRRGDTR